MSTYPYYLTDATDLTNKINNLTNRINIDPEITATLNTIVYNSPNLEVTFNSALSSDESYLLGTMVDNIFEYQISGVDYQFNNMITRPRALYNITSAPTVNHDLYSSFNIGSCIFDSSTSTFYQCIDGTTGAAQWININNNHSNCFAIRDGSSGTINISTTGTGTVIPLTTIVDSFGNWQIATTGTTGGLIVPENGTYHVNYSLTSKFGGALGIIGTVSTIIMKNGIGLTGTQCTISSALSNLSQQIINYTFVTSLSINDILNISALSTNSTLITVPNAVGLYTDITSVASINITKIY